MHFAHGADARSAFPGTAFRWNGGGMTEQSGVRRVAEMRLRGPAGWLPLRVYWPDVAGASDDKAALLVDLPDGVGAAEARCRELCTRTGSVVLSPAGPVSVDDALVVLGWAADHAAELDADPARLLVAGDLADAVVRRTAEDGWPTVARYPGVDVIK
jgi:acetyl esterase/lipase